MIRPRSPQPFIRVFKLIAGVDGEGTPGPLYTSGGAVFRIRRLSLESVAAQPSQFINHGCARINPDKDGEPASPHGSVLRCSQLFGIRARSGLSFVRLPFSGSSVEFLPTPDTRAATGPRRDRHPLISKGRRGLKTPKQSTQASGLSRATTSPADAYAGNPPKSLSYRSTP